MERLMNALRRTAPMLYGPLPYHNWPHASRDVWSNAQILMERCRHYGLEYDSDVIEASCLLHDVVFALDPRDVLLPLGKHHPLAGVREGYHSYFAGCTLSRLGFADPFIEQVVPCVRCTNPKHLPKTTNETIVAASDIMPVGLGSYQKFAREGKELAREVEILTGRTTDKQTCVRFGMSYLGQFTARSLYLGKRYYTPEGTSEWHMGAIHNIVRQCREAGLAERVIVDLTSNGVPAASTGDDTSMTGNITHITLGPNWRWRQRAMAQVARHAKDMACPAPVTLAIPEDTTRLSLPGKLADELYVSVAELNRLKRIGFDPIELRRVLKPGRHLTLYEVQPRRATTPFVETHAFDRINRWLSASFNLADARATAYGYAATYTC